MVVIGVGGGDAGSVGGVDELVDVVINDGEADVLNKVRIGLFNAGQGASLIVERHLCTTPLHCKQFCCHIL